jgi:lantibiotic modifying enzyme
VYREVPTPENTLRVLRSIQANDGSTEHELMWGLAGTLEAAVWMWHATGDARFAEAGRHQVRLLLQAWERPGEGPPTWLQTLYGRRLRYLGAAHGQAGNLHALWSAVEAWPDVADRVELLARTFEFMRSTAVHGPHGTNWAPTLGGEAELLHWCHGAPGFVSALHRVPVGLSGELEDLLRQGAELVWHAGPLRKGHGLCHGTSGNGFALLALWERTSESVWLERARAFAMHALRQRERIREEFGRGWFSLWTGDVGLGVFLCACLEPSAVWYGWERF